MLGVGLRGEASHVLATRHAAASSSTSTAVHGGDPAKLGQQFGWVFEGVGRLLHVVGGHLQQSCGKPTLQRHSRAAIEGSQGQPAGIQATLEGSSPMARSALEKTPRMRSYGTSFSKSRLKPRSPLALSPFGTTATKKAPGLSRYLTAIEWQSTWPAAAADGNQAAICLAAVRGSLRQVCYLSMKRVARSRTAFDDFSAPMRPGRSIRSSVGSRGCRTVICTTLSVHTSRVLDRAGPRTCSILARTVSSLVAPPSPPPSALRSRQSGSASCAELAA